MSERKFFTCPFVSKKWVVLRVSQAPTFAVIRLASINGWKVVAVATPEAPFDWFKQLPSQAKENVVFLSLQSQNDLPYHSVDFLAEGSHARKNLGFLVAMQCGAKVIYEGDEEIGVAGHVVGKKRGKEDVYDTFASIDFFPAEVSREDVPMVAFRHEWTASPFISLFYRFGLYGIWPRGIGASHIASINRRGVLLSERRHGGPSRAPIQHFLSSGVPDVYASSRLLSSEGLENTEYIDTGPVLVDRNGYCPYNDRNTITHAEAFWALYLPALVPAPVADIWRGYWAQRLLWETGARLLVGGPNSVNRRSLERTLIDAKHEDIMYENSTRLVRFLELWEPLRQTTIEDMVMELIDAMGDAAFLAVDEGRIIGAWIDDLSDIGYSGPPLKQKVAETFVVDRDRVGTIVTGQVERGEEAWQLTYETFKSYLSMDVVICLSATGVLDWKPYRNYWVNFTSDVAVKLIYTDDPDIDPLLPKPYTQYQMCYNQLPFSILFQQWWAWAFGHQLLEYYENLRGMKYDRLIRARHDHIFKADPFPTMSQLFPSSAWGGAISVPETDWYNAGCNDRFASGNRKDMGHYFRLWYTLKEPPTIVLHPESYLYLMLRNEWVSVKKIFDITYEQATEMREVVLSDGKEGGETQRPRVLPRSETFVNESQSETELGRYFGNSDKETIHLCRFKPY